MSLEFIQQNAKTIIESSYEYDGLVRGGEETKESESLKKYILSLATAIKKGIEEEKMKIQ